MQQVYDRDLISKKVSFLVGSAELVSNEEPVQAIAPFSSKIISFLNDVSRIIMKDKQARSYPDVVTFAFWIRRSSLSALKDRYSIGEDRICLGRGTVFHIAPSNVPVNFAYSLAIGLMTGNANIVRVPSKDSPQAEIIISALNEALRENGELRRYAVLVRYERDSQINDYFSSMSDVRVIWGGDQTIAEIRRSPLPPRSFDVTFADRFSAAVIDDSYLEREDKERIAEQFYNDTFLSDQNACTSPRVVIWTGDRSDEAREEFWSVFHSYAKKRYHLQPAQTVSKLTSSFIAAAVLGDVHILQSEDHLITRVQVGSLSRELIDLRENSGFFFEYVCNDLMEMKELCDDKRLQTIGYIGCRSRLMELASSGIRGIDRIVPIGRTMDLDLYWDGYDLFASLTRNIYII